MDGVQLSQGKSHFEEAIYFFPLSTQKSLVLILSTLQLPSGFFRKVWERYREIYIERESDFKNQYNNEKATRLPTRKKIIAF